MAQCMVNGEPEMLEFSPNTWGELLGGLDRRLEADRRVVTAARFDGVDQPSFRDPDVTGRPLDDIARIDIEVEDALQLLRESIDAAADSLPELVTSVRLTAAAVRGESPDAAARIGALIVALQSLMSLTLAAATAAEASLGTDADADAALVAGSQRIEEALRTLVARQTEGYHEGIADALDHRLAAAVAGWADVLAPLRARATV